MINVSETAAVKINELLTEENKPGSALRVFVQGGGCSGFQYGLMIEENGQGSGDVVYESNGVKLFVDPVSVTVPFTPPRLPNAKGVKLAYDALGALRRPKVPDVAPADTGMLWSGNANPKFGSWQEAHDWPTGTDRLVSKKICLPSVSWLVWAAAGAAHTSVNDAAGSYDHRIRVIPNSSLATYA